jgi:tRNA threonylcarbamoyladenosine dehydratase
MTKRFARTELLTGREGLDRLKSSSVAVFGIGGIGSYAVEALARAGVGRLIIVDHDIVELSNINRQLLALENTVGSPKVEVACERILQINPDAVVDAHRLFLDESNIGRIMTLDFQFAIDAIDTIESKVRLITALLGKKIRFVSCMGAGNSLSYGGVRVEDVSRTHGCPLARIVRKRLREENITKGVRCVYLPEKRMALINGPAADEARAERSKRPVGSISYLPGISGLTAAGVIINDMLSQGLPGTPSDASITATS